VVKKGAIMVDIDLLYCTYRQQELWHEAAAQALAAHVRPARPRWWARVLDTLTTLLSGLLGRASRRSHACPVLQAQRASQPREERTHLW
jgi:hypothetical protein